VKKTYSGGGWIRPKKRWAIYLRDAVDEIPVCRICGTDAKALASSGRFLTLDHLRGRADGGSNKPVNLRTACDVCNRTRRCHPYPWRGLDDDQVVAEVAQQQVELDLASAAQLLEDPPWWVWKLRANTHTHFATVAHAQLDLDDDRPGHDPEPRDGHDAGDDQIAPVWGVGDDGEQLPF
jgi:hypothetical protein